MKLTEGMPRPYSAFVWQEKNEFVAQCVQYQVSARGASAEEALKRLRTLLLDPDHEPRPAGSVISLGRLHSMKNPAAGLE